MSLLVQAREYVVAYLEEVTTDSDGNKFTRPSQTGSLREHGFSRSDSRKTHPKSEDGGFLTVSRYGLRFPRSWPDVLGAQSQIEWRGKRYSVEGDALIYNGSRRTAHVAYVMERRYDKKPPKYQGRP